MSSITAFLTPILTALSLYAAQKSYLAIINLRQYEERSEKAAKHSKTAAQQLWKTRVTQGSSAATIMLSLLSSLFVFANSLSSKPSASSSRLIPVLNVAATTAAFLHNRSFWKAKAKVPFVQGFNEGIQKSGEIRQLMVALGVGWAVLGAITWVW